MYMGKKLYDISPTIIGGNASAILCHKNCWNISEIMRKILTDRFFVCTGKDARFNNDNCKSDALFFNESSIK